MLTFGLFLLAVTLYVLFLLWCFAPLRSIPGIGLSGWLRVVLGGWLLGANILPILAFPFIAPFIPLNQALAEKAFAIPLFVRTLPIYVYNVFLRPSSDDVVVELEFPLSIGDTSYRPRLKIICTKRKLLSVDKFVDIHVFPRYPTIIASDFIGQTGDATVVIGPPHNFCSPTANTQLQIGPYPQRGYGFGPAAYLVRGEADKTTIYEMRFYGDSTVIDDITLQQPHIIGLERRSASAVIPTGALWPMPQNGEMSIRTPELIQAYRRLGVTVNGCVERVWTEMDFQSRTTTSKRSRATDLRHVPLVDRPAYCRRELSRKVGKPDATAMTPVAN